MLEFVLREHFRLAAHAALLFAVGLFVSWPVIRYRLRGVALVPLAVFRVVLKLIGPAPSIARTAAVVFCFNGAVMFLCMASGFHPLPPKLLGIWTGLNIGVITGLARQEPLMAAGGSGPGRWAPPRWLTALCSLAVLTLELPCFWLALAMGMSMGHAVQAGTQSYLEALTPRAGAYGAVILPALLLSAVAEAVAVRGSSAPSA